MQNIEILLKILTLSGWLAHEEILQVAFGKIIDIWDALLMQIGIGCRFLVCQVMVM
jgi:hypothetical protein